MKIDYKTLKFKKQTLFLCLLSLCIGGVIGTGIFLLRLKFGGLPVLSLDALRLSVSVRDIRQLIMTDVIFSFLILISAVLFRHRAVRFLLFLIKGFFISYFCILFVYYFHAGGLWTAIVLLFFHSFLLLPLQVTTAVSLSVCQGKADERKRLLSLSSIHVAAAVCCILLERISVPALLLPH